MLELEWRFTSPQGLGEEQHRSVLPPSLSQSGLVLWHNCVLLFHPGPLMVSVCSGAPPPEGG